MLRKPGSEIGAKARGNRRQETDERQQWHGAADNEASSSRDGERQATRQAAVGMGSGRQWGNRQQGKPLPAGGRKQEVWE